MCQCGNLIAVELVVTYFIGCRNNCFRPKLEDLSVEAIIHSPVWTFAGKYVLDVKAGPIEITGKGDIQGEFSKYSNGSSSTQ